MKGEGEAHVYTSVKELGIVRLVIGAAEVDDLGVDTPEGDHRGRGVGAGPPVSGGDHRALRIGRITASR